MDENRALAKNNPTDRKAYLDYMLRQKSMEKDLDIKAKLLRVKRNLDAWNDSFPKYASITIDSFQDRILKLTTPPLSHTMERVPSLVVASKNEAIREAYINTAIKAGIARGIITPSEVVFTTLSEGTANISGIYQSREWKDTVFNKKNKVIVVNNANSDPYQTGARDNARFWGELSQFCEVHHIALMISYQEVDRGGQIKEITMGNGTRGIAPLTNDIKEDIRTYGRLKMGFINFNGMTREEIFRNDK